MSTELSPNPPRSIEFSRREFLTYTGVLVGGSAAVGWLSRPLFERPQKVCEEKPVETRLSYREIDLSVLPDAPPAAVVSQIDTVLAIRGTFNASAVKIADDLVLSARHIFGKTPPEDTQCNNNFYFVGNNNGGNEDSRAVSLNPRNGLIPDIVLIKTSEHYPYYDLPNAPISPQPVYAGEPLFFLNYEPNSLGEMREPNEPAVPKLELAAPAFFGGIPIGRETDGKIVIATGLKNYNPNSPDMFTRGGASGGPIFDRHGELKAIHVAGGRLPVLALEKRFNISLTGTFRERDIALSYAEPVTPQLIDELKAKLAAFPAADCN